MKATVEAGAVDARVREYLEERLARQLVHPVHPLVEVLWEQGWTEEAVWMRIGPVVEEVAPEHVADQITRRNRLITLEKTDPLRYLCEPEEYRLIDLECVRKRLTMPGVQLGLWVSGGIRSSKTEFVTRRIAANFWFTEEAWCWGFHQTDTTSRSIQQARVARFLPPEMNPDSGKLKKNRTTKFSYSEGTGFTGSEFNVYWNAKDELEQMHRFGGRFEFRFYGQDPGTMVGQELTCATCDELVPPSVVKLIDDRLLTRAADTRHPVFLKRLQEAEKLLEAGEPLPLPLLGAVYHGWNLMSFTPKEGWTPTCAMLLQGAREYGHYDPRPMVEAAMREAVEAIPEPVARERRRAQLAENPWKLGALKEVPRFAQPVDERKLVAFLPTFANKFKGNWPGAVQAMQGRSDEELQITLFGIVRRNVQSLLGYNAGKHVQKETALPIEGTIYEVADPAPKKPWVIKWYLVDAVGRAWVVQEWPCPDWEIPGKGFPGMWAVPSEGVKINGDKGPAQRLEIANGWDDWTRRVWAGRKRLGGVHGRALRGPLLQERLTWEDGHEMEGPFVEVADGVMDSRFASAPTKSQGGTESTPLVEMNEAENAVLWKQASGAHEETGLLMLKARLGSEIVGMPGMVCLKECKNTQFAWNTYAMPEDSEHTRKNDEACKDFIDADRYFLAMDPFHEGEEVIEERPMSRRQRAEWARGVVW